MSSLEGHHIVSFNAGAQTNEIAFIREIAPVAEAPVTTTSGTDTFQANASLLESISENLETTNQKEPMKKSKMHCAFQFSNTLVIKRTNTKD